MQLNKAQLNTSLSAQRAQIEAINVPPRVLGPKMSVNPDFFDGVDR